MKQYYLIKRFKLFNSPVFVHWTAILVIMLIIVTSYKTPLLASISAISYFSILLIHEFGHGFIASRLGYKVFETRIGFFHGLCISEEPYNEIDHIKIAWAGSLAQLVIAIPLVTLSNFKIFSELSYFGPVYVFLGYFSMAIALFNLAPAKGLDGYIAWKIIPRTYRKWKSQ